MAEWLYERGIGEARAALIEGDRIVEAAIEPDDIGLRVGTVARARLVELLPGRAGRLQIDGHEAQCAAIPAGVTQGATLTVEIVREALPEPGRIKPARAVATDAAAASGPDLHARLLASGFRFAHPDLDDALADLRDRRSTRAT